MFRAFCLVLGVSFDFSFCFVLFRSVSDALRERTSPPAFRRRVLLLHGYHRYAVTLFSCFLVSRFSFV